MDMTLKFNLNMLKFHSLSQLCPLQLLKLYYFFFKELDILESERGHKQVLNKNHQGKLRCQVPPDSGPRREQL